MVGPEAQEAGEWNWVCFATAEPLTAVRDRLNEHVVYQVATGDDYVSDIPIGELRGVGSQNFSLGGLEHCPSGKFFANAAWLACAVIAHNLIRWAAHLLS